MRRHISRYVQTTAGGERTRHFTARQPPVILKLDSGDPFFPTPPHIRAAAQHALDAGLTRYAPGQGDPEFLAAVCETVERQAGARYSPDDVFATNGATSGIYAVFTAFLDPGDEVIVFDPTFSLSALVARQLGAVPVAVPHGPDYHIDVEGCRPWPPYAPSATCCWWPTRRTRRSRSRAASTSCCSPWASTASASSSSTRSRRRTR